MASLMLPVYCQLYAFRRREQRRAVHPRYDFSAASGDSAGPSSQRRQVTQQFSLPVRKLPTLGAELEMLHTGLSQERGPEASASDVVKLGKQTAASANEAQDEVPPNHGTEPASTQPKAEAGSRKEHVATTLTVSSQRQQRTPPPTVFDETEQIVRVGAQGPAAGTLDSAESCGIRHRRYLDRGRDSVSCRRRLGARFSLWAALGVEMEKLACLLWNRLEIWITAGSRVFLRVFAVGAVDNRRNI